jgi:hypothetical protein
MRIRGPYPFRLVTISLGVEIASGDHAPGAYRPTLDEHEASVMSVAWAEDARSCDDS